MYIVIIGTIRTPRVYSLFGGTPHVIIPCLVILPPFTLITLIYPIVVKGAV